MMNDMMPGMMWGRGLAWLLVVIVLILAAAALIKYLHGEQGRSAMNKLVIGALSTVALLSPALGGPGDAERGERDFRVCAPCHSLEPDRNMTGPNLRPKPMTFMYDGSAR